jgi:hypothetical protein
MSHRARAGGLNRLRLLEFFLIGLVMGIVEDVLAILLATDAKIDLRVVAVAGLVALPFAVISELVVDQRWFPAFVKRLLKIEHQVVHGVEVLESRLEGRPDSRPRD